MTRRLIFLPRPRNVDLLALLAEAIITALAFFALGFALVVLAALATPIGG